ncbi:MAG: class I SAM-dependent methyltransferase [Ignavibacteriae bacterium]|nr:class I SAM-dependent methyltransferase [Ignavibacteriota bacterium]
MIKSVKQIAKKILPQSVVDGLIELKKEKVKLGDLSKIELIRNKNVQYLSNPKLLETELLLELGLNNELLVEFPEELYGYCGKGLLHWQYPKQFSKYLAQISTFNIETYLEIGVRHGGTFVITVEYLEKFHHIKKAIGVDLGTCPTIIEYKKINHVVDFIQQDSQTKEFKNLINNSSTFDLVLIDGAHEENMCKNDFETVKGKANIAVFHDITSDACPGVGNVWNYVKNTYPDEYQFFEFTEQYDSVRKRTSNVYLGIGMAVKNDFLKRISQ